MIYVLITFFGLMTYFIFSIQKDIISPEFVFCTVFFISCLNVLTNVDTLRVTIYPVTVIIVMLGTLFFCIGAFIAKRFRSNFRNIHIKMRRKSGKSFLTTKKLLFLVIFNIISIVYILSEVYIMTVKKAYYQGDILGALSVYAEVSKFSSIDMKVSIISTLLTALCEAEGYVLGYIIVYNLASKLKNSILLLLCFVTAFISTFCQGSRGGIFMILACIIEYIMIYRDKKGSNRISVGIIRRIIMFVCTAVVIFQGYAVVSGKNWNVSFYEYLSVYLGDPLINLNTKINLGIERTKIFGECSFGPLLNNILPKFGIAIPKYTGLAQFQFSNGHSLGNVYTIFAYLIADFGYIGMNLVMLIIGFIGQMIYDAARKRNVNRIFFRILYGYYITCVAFSFFSNKVCENINMYHIYMFIFVFLFTMLIQENLKSNI